MKDNLFLQDKKVAERYGISRVTVWRWVSDGDFPKPVKFSSGCSRWRILDLEKWETEKIKETS